MAPLLLSVLPQLPLAEQERKPSPGTQGGRAPAPSPPGPASLWGAPAAAQGWPWAGGIPPKQHRHRHGHCPVRQPGERSAPSQARLCF